MSDSNKETEMRVVRGRAPVRFCDLGGWTDTRICPKGAVMSLTASLYTHARLEVRRGGRGFEFESHDTNELVTLDQVTPQAYDGTLDLLKAAVARFSLTTGAGNVGPGYSVDSQSFRLSVRSDVPPGSGLGTSAALGVAVVAVLARYLDQRLLPHEAARLAQKLETEELKLECGVQDQLAAAYGGVNFMSINYPGAHVRPVQLSQPTRCELERRMVLVYTGRSHFSTEMHQKVIREYEAGANLRLFEQLARCAVYGRDCLETGDLDGFGEAMMSNWEAQKGLHPDITTEEIERLYQAVGSNAVGFKANGAGGGGTVTILAAPDTDHVVRRIVTELDMTVLPSQLDDRGLQVWS